MGIFLGALIAICGRSVNRTGGKTRLEIQTLMGGGKTGGKAWFGGLACSGLAGYRARRTWGDVCVQHFYPLSFCDKAIIPSATDKTPT